MKTRNLYRRNKGTRKRLVFMTKMLLCAAIVVPPLSWSAGESLARAAESGINASATNLNPVSEELRSFAEETVRRLAGTAPFTAWSDAKTIIEPLGPGTHSWLVTVQPGGAAPGSATSGYLIISATDSGEYKLVEYGIGPESLYSLSALLTTKPSVPPKAQSANIMKIEKLYAGPTLAQWKLSSLDSKLEPVQFFDAANGELLPETADSWDRQAADYSPPSLAAGSRHQRWTPDNPVYTAEGFDPYDNILWMTKKAMNIKKQSFESLLQATERLLFVSAGPKRTYSVPLPVFGYQKWTADRDEVTYALTGTESSPRWIALDALIGAGYFVEYGGNADH